MENQVYLKRLSNNQPQGGRSDINAPLSFLEWKSSLVSLVERDAVEHYNSYVLEWFSINKQKTVTKEFLLRQKYLYMLDQLQLFFSTDEKNNWYSQVNLADEKELLLAIPYFAKKLKNISLYYLNLRRKLKHTKLKYNIVGSVAGIEQEVYRYLLETFSDDNNELSPTLQTIVPSFSALQKSLSIQIEELYDDAQYFDLSPTQPKTEYFDFLNQATSNFLATKGIVLSSADWLFESFDVPVSVDNFNTVFSQMTGVLFETTDNALYSSFVQKYIAENKYAIAAVPPVSSVTTTDVSISTGNNYFFYPYGTTKTTYATTTQLPIVALSSLQFSDATAGSTLEDSDTIIVKYGNTLKAAWLRAVDYEEIPKNVKAAIKKDTTTSFIYPFPGYGLSGVDLPWTGSGFATNPEYNFLSIDLKAMVNEAYWSQVLPVDSCNTLLLNNTTLANDKAIAHTDPRFADQFYTRLSRSTDTKTPYGELSGAWLYKFTRTALPVSPSNENVFLWPYTKVDITASYPSHLEQIDFSKSCNTVSIQDLPRFSFTAASKIEEADVICKLGHFDDEQSNALEYAWLSGSTVKVAATQANYNEILAHGLSAFAAGGINGYQYVNQDGFSALFASGETVRFIWQGPKTSIAEAFKAPLHRKDCPFVTNIPAVADFEWEKCTCRQVYHSPFGHAFKTFAEGNYTADCVLKVPDDQLTSFDFGSWRDTLGQTLSGGPTKAQFSWYRTTKNYTWGGGRWVCDAILGETTLYLYPGKSYIYRRATKKTTGTTLPPYAVNYNFYTSVTKWVEAKRDKSGNWISTNKPSNMLLYPGDFIKVDKQIATTHALLSVVFEENVKGNVRSVWSTYDVVPVICGTENSTTIAWPVEQKPFGSTDVQYPTVKFNQISAIKAWSVQNNKTREIQTVTDLNTVNFVPPVTGTYSIAVTALKLDGTLVYESTNIPQITCVPQFKTNNYSSVPFTTPTCGFLIEHPLKGWNYNTRRPDKYSTGARPYWAVMDAQKTSTTRYKGIYSWGYPDEYVDDEYVPNNNPIISPIELTFGTVIEYKHTGYAFEWNQPITYKQHVGSTQWCLLSTDLTKSSNLSAFYKIKERIDPIVTSKIIPSDIQLSNTIEGAPLEIFYYALKPFLWSINFTTFQEPVAPSLSSYFIADAPWENLTNRFTPTIANVPVAESLYSLQDVGGYFLPQHLGASQFVNKDFDILLNSNVLTGTALAESVNIHIGGRGRTKQDQPSVFDWTENNQWLKESVTTGNLAGSTKKSLTKTLQSFIPYQSNLDEVALGLVTARSRFSPWGGKNDEEWTDTANNPKSFTGVSNVGAWANSQVLKQNEKAIDSWTSDIYGNQYGLFKDLTNIPVTEHENIPGELWIKTNSQSVDAAVNILSDVFLQFEGFGSTIYDELTGNKIQIVDCYFDTLFIKTPSIALFVKITYNYETDKIEAVFDDVRWMKLNVLDVNNPSANLQFNKNWIFSEEKKIYTLYTHIVNGNEFYPCLHELDLSTKSYKSVFSLSDRDVAPIYFKTISKGSLHYNKSLNAFLITYTGIDQFNKMFVIDYYVKNESSLTLTKVDKYVDMFDPTIQSIPPVVLSEYLSPIQIGLNTFAIKVSATNNPTSFSLINYTSAVKVDNTGLFTGRLPAGTHHINYSVGNNAGESIHCLTLNVVNIYDTKIRIGIKIENGSLYANNNDGELSITCFGLLTSYNIRLRNNYYTAFPNTPLVIRNLDSNTYELGVTDLVNGERTVNVTVGYSGVTGVSAISLPVPSSIEGHFIDKPFAI